MNSKNSHTRFSTTQARRIIIRLVNINQLTNFGRNEKNQKAPRRFLMNFKIPRPGVFQTRIKAGNNQMESE